ncbi:MAG: hypothetical protein A2170_07200 [Deltaproteobacteria bacterium RBG_13_53_10]|nr:MAG: hypothetical protein A2170_07200 [Deltaproteobacteria bacterium RBG_13_53_10]
MRNRMRLWMIVFVLAVFFVGITGNEVASQTEGSAEAFYKGKVIKMILPYSPGDGIDTWVRALIPYLEKHTGAKVLVDYMPGAGGLLGAGHLYSAVKPNGLTVGALQLTGLVTSEMLELQGVKFEVEKFSYIGRIDVVWRILFASKASGFKSIEDMRKATKPIRWGCTSTTSASAVDIAVMSEAFGLKSKITTGYKGSREYMTAVMAGRELDAISAYIPGYEKYVQQGDLTMVAVQGNRRFPDFPQVPAISEFQPLNPEGKKLLDLLNVLIDAGRYVVVAPPGLSEDNRLFLEKALLETLKEPQLLDWAKKSRVTASPLPGTECKKLVNRLSEIAPKAERPKLKYILTEKYF